MQDAWRKNRKIIRFMAGFFYENTEKFRNFAKKETMLYQSGHHADLIKWMDSGTVLFRAADRKDAIGKVCRLLQEMKGTVETDAAGTVTADFSDFLWVSLISACVEETSEPGRFSASFREGNRCRLPWVFPSRKALSRMRSVIQALAQ